MSIFTICQKLHPFATLSFRWKTSDTNLKRRSLFPRSFWKDTQKGIGRPQGCITGLYYMPGRDRTHRWPRSRGSHGCLEPKDQDKRGRESNESVQCPPMEGSLRLLSGPPMAHVWHSGNFHEPQHRQVITSYRLHDATDDQTSAIWDSYDSGRPDRPHWPSLVSQPSSKATSVRKPHPLTVES